MTRSDRHALAALAALILLQVIMLSALYAGIAPHPPNVTPLFGMGPFIGASISIALAAIIVHPLSSAPGRSLSVLAALMALVSFGPQKYFDAQFGLIWPAVVLGQLSALLVFVSVLNAIRQRKDIGKSDSMHQRRA
ncbi:MAG: hypothetical protein AAF724_04960 [Pseudomonadota bacterium]